MKLLTFVSVLMFAVLPACGDDANAAGGMMDKLTDAAKDATKGLKGTLTTLTSKLEGVTDGATAEKAKAGLEGIVSKLGGMDIGGMLKGLGGDASSATSGLMAQVTRLMGNAEVTKVIGPLLEKVKGMIGG